MKRLFHSLGFLLMPVVLMAVSYALSLTSGCANIVAPMGGPRDSIPPVLVSALPKDSSTAFNARKIVLTFDEFVQLDNITENLIISPTPKRNPEVVSKLRTVTITLKDTPEANTTYHYDFGRAIKDVNEGNILRNFQYAFSTGKELDYGTLSGNVLLAETGKKDTTLFVVLYRHSRDSAVYYEKPRYTTRLDGAGRFTFRHLPSDTFYLYTLKDEGGTRRYQSPAQLFGFAESPVVISDSVKPITLYAYVREAAGTSKNAAPPPSGKAAADKRLRIENNLDNGELDLLKGLEFYFRPVPLKTFDTTKVLLTNESFQPLTGYRWTVDTSNTKVKLNYGWEENTTYHFIVDKDFATDTLGRQLTKKDTLTFHSRRASMYGSVRLRFLNLDLSRNPVLQFVTNDQLAAAYPLTGKDFYARLFQPGDYDLRILYDDNKNGVWDPGDFFGTRRQPERVRPIDRKLTIKPNWDNEADITL